MTCWLTGMLCVLDVLGVLACFTCSHAYVFGVLGVFGVPDKIAWLACFKKLRAWRA